MNKKQFGILTVSNDLHALAVKKQLAEDAEINCHIITTDNVAGGRGFTWSNLDRPRIGFSIATRVLPG